MPRDPTPTGSSATHRAGAWRPLVLAAVVVATIVLAAVSDLGGRLAGLRDTLDGLGPWAPLAFLALYVAAVLAAIPGSALTLAAGSLFGWFEGLLLVSVGSTVGAALAFLIARRFAREAIERRFADSERFRRLDALTERHGAWVVLLVRLVPLFPFSLVNYGFGLTRIRFWTYVLWSWLGMLPGTALYVVGGDALVAGLSRGEVPWMLVAVAAVLLALVLVLGYAARKHLPQDEADTR